MCVLKLQNHKGKQCFIQEMETPQAKVSSVALIHDVSCIVYGRD